MGATSEKLIEGERLAAVETLIAGAEAPVGLVAVLAPLPRVVAVVPVVALVDAALRRCPAAKIAHLRNSGERASVPTWISLIIPVHRSATGSSAWGLSARIWLTGTVRDPHPQRAESFAPNLLLIDTTARPAAVAEFQRTHSYH